MMEPTTTTSSKSTKKQDRVRRLRYKKLIVVARNDQLIGALYVFRRKSQLQYGILPPRTVLNLAARYLEKNAIKQNVEILKQKLKDMDTCKEEAYYIYI